MVVHAATPAAARAGRRLTTPARAMSGGDAYRAASPATVAATAAGL